MGKWFGVFIAIVLGLPVNALAATRREPPPATPASTVSTDLRPAVSINQGMLLGVRDRDLRVFRGIPFAGPPIGEWRWRPPRPASTWRGTRDASAFGPACPQPIRPNYNEEDLAGRPMSEDCLHLNVWTPAAEGGARLPVMLWLLPGGFTVGDASMAIYDGAALARRGVVVVTFNYRLGLFGTFAHPALSRAQANEPLGNYNLMDQVAAMRWVRSNIAAFGGDPGNVTLFGMSAGGMSVNYQLASPASAGLFDKAISQSSALRMSYDRRLREDANGFPSLESEGATHALRLGIDGDDATVVRRLRAMTTEQWLEYQMKNPIGIAGGLTPVIDGIVLPEPVGTAFRAGHEHKVPYMTGGTNWESSLVRGGAKALPGILGILNVTRAEVDALYSEPDEGLLVWKVYSDFWLSTQRYLAQAHARGGSPTWVYRFSRVLDGHQGDYYGASHGAETRYVFGTLDSASRIANPAHPGNFGYRVNDTDRAYSDTVARYWVNFAKYGNPNGDGLPGWPSRTAGDDLILEFGQQQPALRRDLLKDRWRFFETHFDAGRL